MARILRILPGFMDDDDAKRMNQQFDELVCLNCGKLANRKDELPPLGVAVEEQTKLSEHLN